MKKWKKEHWFMLLITGMLLFVIALPLENRTEVISKKAEAYDYEKVNCKEEDYVRYIEEKLEKILGKVAGVGKVSVMITLASSGEKIVEKEEENDSEHVVYSHESGYESPYVKEERMPEIEGVLVVAEGGGNAVIQKKIVEVVQALFHVETHKIRVMKHN